MFKTIIKALNREKRLAELEATVETLKNDRKRMELEWEDTYEKFRLLYVRLSKRVRQSERAPEGEGTQRGESGELGEPENRSSLSPRQLEANARILARRGRKVVAM